MEFSVDAKVGGSSARSSTIKACADNRLVGTTAAGQTPDLVESGIESH